MRRFKIKSNVESVESGVSIIYLDGHLDAHSVERFEDEIQRNISSNIFNLLINCEKLDYISSAGMGIIMGYLDEVREKNGDIKLCCVNDKVFEIFDLVGFTEIYDFMKSEEEALEKFKDG